MIIVVDYDNDAVRIGSNEAFAHGIESKIVNYKITGSMKQIQGLIVEIVNALCEHADANTNISLLKQDEGQLTTIEEY